MDYASNVVVMMITVVAAVSMVTAKTIVVGGDIGWTIPPAATTYSDWASNQTFFVSDVLVFNFFTGAHNVAEVTETAYENCDSSGIMKLHSTAPVNITLDRPGQVFFFCAVGNHCNAGLKLAVNVTGGHTSPSPAPAPLMASSAAATSTSSSALFPGPLVVLMLITATAMLMFV